MLRHIVAGAVALLFAAQVAVAADPKTDEEKTLYALGVALSRNLASFSLSPDELKIVEQGLSDGVAGDNLKVDMAEFGPKIQAFAKDRATKSAAKEKEASKGFVDKAAAEKGATKLPSGVIYSRDLARHRPDAEADRPRQGALHRQAHQRRDVRQLGRSRRAGRPSR